MVQNDLVFSFDSIFGLGGFYVLSILYYVLIILFLWACFLILLVHFHYSRDMCLALRQLYTCPGCCSSLLWVLDCWGSSWVSAGPRHVSWLLALSGQISPEVKQSQIQPGRCQIGSHAHVIPSGAACINNQILI